MTASLRIVVPAIAPLAALCLAMLPACAEIPEHPSKLVFPDLEYTPPDPARHRHVLPCGVPVYVVEDHELPLIDLTVLVRAGAYLEPEGKAGLAALTGSQLRTGGTAKWTPEELDEELAFLAANVATSIGDTDGTASVNCLSKDLQRVLELFLEILRSPRFDEARLALKKDQDLQSLARRNDETSRIEGREWERLLRGPEFFAVDHVTRSTLEGITREDLLAFHKRTFHPRNFIIAVAGDVRTTEILERLEAALGPWAREPAGAPVPPVPAPGATPRPGVYIVDKASVNQGRVSIGHLSTMRKTPDFHALYIMNQVLGGGGFTSRITSKVRSDKGLAYSAGSRFDFGIYFDGTFRANFQSKSESVAEATAIVLEEIRRMRSEEISREELETAVNYAVGIFPRFFATAPIVASTFANDELTGRDPAFWPTYREKMQAVTAADVLRVSQKYLKPDSLVILVVGNTAEILKEGVVAHGALEKAAGGQGIQRIPLPDPLTLEYPKG